MQKKITAEYLASQGLSANFPERFWSKVNKTAHCWIWTAAIKNGYGVLRRGVKPHKNIHAHKASWILNHGPVPKGKCVLHNCQPLDDNKACVRPDHIWCGTVKQNNHDTMNKGRSRGQFKKGHSIRRGKLKLSSDRVAEIRLRKQNESYESLKKRFELGVSTLWKIVKHRTYKNI